MQGEQLIKELGADSIWLYDKKDIAQCKEKFDIVFDAVGKYDKNLCRNFLNEGGTFVSVNKAMPQKPLNNYNC